MPSFALLQQKTATPSSAPPGCAGMTTRSVLSINQPGDGYEQEADRLAERVMRMTAPAAPAAMRPRTRIGVQRACACGGTCNRRRPSRRVSKGDECSSLHGGTPCGL
jgi:hypothetical protein